MNVAKLKILCIINIVLLFPRYYFAVSDCIEPLDSENNYSEKSDTSSHIEDSHEPSKKPIKTNNKELLRLSSEVFELRNSLNLLLIKERTNSESKQIAEQKQEDSFSLEQKLKKEFIKSKFAQLKDAIRFNSNQNKEWLKKELEKFVNYIDTQDSNGDTLLHIAVPIKNIKILEYLIRYGADYKMKNDMGQTPTDIVNSFRENLKSKENRELIKFWHKKVMKKEDIIFQAPKFNKFEELKNKFNTQIKKFKRLKSLKFSISYEDEK